MTALDLYGNDIYPITLTLILTLTPESPAFWILRRDVACSVHSPLRINPLPPDAVIPPVQIGTQRGQSDFSVVRVTYVSLENTKS